MTKRVYFIMKPLSFDSHALTFVDVDEQARLITITQDPRNNEYVAIFVSSVE